MKITTINGRYIKAASIAKAIEEAYKPFMMQHKYPFTLLHFTIEPGFLDVNVHPTKMELRFKDQELIYKTVFHAISAALSHKELIPEVELGEKQAEKNIPQPKPVRIREPEPFEVNRAAERVAQPAAPYGRRRRKMRPEAVREPVNETASLPLTSRDGSAGEQHLRGMCRQTECFCLQLPFRLRYLFLGLTRQPKLRMPRPASRKPQTRFRSRQTPHRRHRPLRVRQRRSR